MATRIAFAYDFAYPWHKGGIEKMNMIESRELAKKYEVHFLTMRWPGMRKDFTTGNVHYHAMFGISQKSAYPHGRRSITKAILYALSLFRLFRYRFDLVVVDAFPYWHLPVVMLYKYASGCKVAVRVAEVWDREYWQHYLGWLSGILASWLSDAALARWADIYIANSATTKEKMMQRYGIADSRIKVSAPVLDYDRINAIKRKFSNGSGKRVIFAGRLIKEKRLDKWLSVMSRVVKAMPNAKGIIIGDGPEKKNLLDIIKRLGITGSIKIMPPIGQDELYKEIAKSSLLLNMSEREGLSIITLESLALGTPVVLPDYSPIPDSIKDMCVVVSEEGLPKIIVRMLKAQSKSAFIRHEWQLSEYSTESIGKFYDDVFAKLKIL